MLKKGLLLLFALLLLLSLSACTPLIEMLGGEDYLLQHNMQGGQGTVNPNSTADDGASNHQVGETISTTWFAFSVDSAAAVDQYAGYTPLAGNQLIDVVLTETGLDSRNTPLYPTDFSIQYDGSSGSIFSIDPIDDTMMPTLFELAQGESLTSHLVFEVPDGVTNLTIKYVEIDELNEAGRTFLVDLGI